MKYTLLILLLAFCFTGNAQVDKGKLKGIKIDAIDTSDVKNKSLAVKPAPIVGITNKKTDTPLDFKPKEGTSRKRAGVNFSDNSRLPLPSWDIKQSFGENRKNVSKFERDYFLGSLNTKSKFFRIKCRDHEYEDGDRIELVLNGKTIIPNVTLRNSYYIIDVKLQDGNNTIEFVALNEGSSSPNTAQLEVYDENEVLVASNQWLLTTGYKAQLRVFKN